MYCLQRPQILGTILFFKNLSTSLQFIEREDYYIMGRRGRNQRLQAQEKDVFRRYTEGKVLMFGDREFQEWRQQE